MIEIEEIWKDIEGYENKYQVSNLGGVRSLNYNNTGKPKELKQKVNRYGYYEVKLSKNNKTKNFLVSTLVARAFVQNTFNKPKVMHKTADKKNNKAENLTYGYIPEIKFKMYEHGVRKGKYSGNKISYKGKRYKTLSALARDYDLTPKLLFKRISHGWTLEEALEIPLERKQYTLHKQLYKYNGKIYSVKELAQISGLNERTIYKRLKRGWGIEEAVEIPPVTKGRLGKNENEF